MYDNREVVNLLLESSKKNCKNSKDLFDGEKVVAKVFEENIMPQYIGIKSDDQISSEKMDLSSKCLSNRPLQNLNKIIWSRLSKDFITKNGLEATEKEVLELQDYHNKAQKKASVSEDDEYCLDSKNKEIEMNRRFYIQLVEIWKIYDKLYEKYGGLVSIAKTGLVPVEAVRSLLSDYQKQGYIHIYDDSLNEELWRRHSEIPRFVAPKGEIDFTPYWKKQ